jgi:hypothetical protein
MTGLVTAHMVLGRGLQQVMSARLAATSEREGLLQHPRVRCSWVQAARHKAIPWTALQHQGRVARLQQAAGARQVAAGGMGGEQGRAGRWRQAQAAAAGATRGMVTQRLVQHLD